MFDHCYVENINSIVKTAVSKNWLIFGEKSSPKGSGCLRGIRHLMLFSDLENLLSIGRICYQLGESYLNVFLLHEIENLWSVRNLWSIFTLLSVLENLLSSVRAKGEGGESLSPPSIFSSCHLWGLADPSHRLTLIKSLRRKVNM